MKNLICTISEHNQGYSCNWKRIKNTLLCVKEGEIEIKCGTVKKRISCGESVLIPAGAVGITNFIQENNRVFLFLFDAVNPSGQEITFFNRNPFATQLISDLYVAYLNGESNQNYYLSGFYMLMYHYQRCREIPPKFRKIHELISEIERNYAQNLALSDYAKMVLMSESNLRLLFRQYTGKSIIEYRNAVRLKRAEELELAGFSTAEIADMVGFSSASYYCRRKKQKAES